MTGATIYLRLSDFRDDNDGFDGREARLRAEAGRLGWAVDRVVVENDVIPSGNGNGRSRPASAFKRRKVVTPSGRTEWRVYRPGFRSVLDDLTAGRTGALLCEDLDRACRDPRDLEDLVDTVAAAGASARSLSGSLTLTNGGTDAEVTMARIMVAMGNKASRDTARRVSAKRADLAEAGWYGGGRRPFGYRPDPDAPKHRKTLIPVPAEADEIKAAAGALLAGTSLKAVARDWRERGIPSVTGAKWTAETVRDVLLKPTVAGLAVVRNGKITTVPARWPAILDRETWEALTARLDEPTITVTLPNGGTYTGPRKTTTGNEPRYLLSLIARCHCGGQVKVNGGRAQAPSYVCTEGYHLRRKVAATDEVVTRIIVAVLSRPDAADLLRPPSRPGVDVPALRAETARLDAIGKRQARMHALGEISDAEMREGSRARKARLDEIAGLLPATVTPDPLGEFRGQADAAAVWGALPLPRKRAIVRLLADVTLLPARRHGRQPGGGYFDPETVEVTPRT